MMFSFPVEEGEHGRKSCACPSLDLFLLPHRDSRGFYSWKRAGDQGGSEPGTKIVLTKRGSRVLSPDPQFHAETIALKPEPQPLQT